MSSTGRLTLVLAVSGLAHVGVLALLATLHPQLRQAPPPPVFEVEVVPRFLPGPARATARSEPAAARPLRPRRLLRPEERSDVAPLVTPAAPAAPDRRGAPGPAAPAADLRNALRRGAVGCANPSLLSKDERAACLEALGRGARDAPFIEPPIAPDKKSEWDKAAERKRAKWRAREGPLSAPVPQGPSSPSQAPNPFPEVWTPRN